MNITQHAKVRYVQRIEGVVDEREAKQRVAQDDERIVAHMNKLVDQAELIWEGKIGDFTPKRYLIADDIILVTDPVKLALVTVYRCDFGFPPTVNRQTVKGLMSEIRKLREKSEKEVDRQQAHVDRMSVETENLDVQIQAKQAELDALQARKQYVEAELNALRHGPVQIESTISSIAAKLVNSVDLRKDILVAKYSG